MKRLRTLLILSILVVAVLPAEEYLPTPYTAEEIRDAWVEGFEVLTRTRSTGGETYSRTRVVASSDDGFTIVEVETDGNGVVEPGAEPRRFSGKWEDLRDHAKFPISQASRERADWETPLGRLEGWLYLVEGDEGVTEFFFADGLPGPPVVYRRPSDGGEGFVAEQMARGVRAE